VETDSHPRLTILPTMRPTRALIEIFLPRMALRRRVRRSRAPSPVDTCPTHPDEVTRLSAACDGRDLSDCSAPSAAAPLLAPALAMVEARSSTSTPLEAGAPSVPSDAQAPAWRDEEWRNHGWRDERSEWGDSSRGEPS
jgi:hypothetical protein